MSSQCRLPLRVRQSLPASNPLVLARMGWTQGAPTIVIYGHYDVQVRRTVHARRGPRVLLMNRHAYNV